MVSLLIALCLTSSAATAQTQPRIETGFLDRSVSLEAPSTAQLRRSTLLLGGW